MIRLRALVALLALMLFPVFVLALLAGAVWTVVLLAGNNHSSLPAVKFLVIPLLFAVYWAVKDVRRLAASPVDGPSVSRDDQPRLWAEIDRLAQVAQTEPPARLVVVPDVNAAVTEVAGRREMLIGLPLLAGTSVGQLRSVLAHELGHFAGGDTEAAAKTYRWAMLLHRVRDNASGPVRWLLSLYVWFFTRASAASNRDVERAADGFSVRVAGAPTAAASIRRMAELDVAWSVLNDRYVPLFEAAGARAPLHTGMRSLLEANQEPIAEAVAEDLRRSDVGATTRIRRCASGSRPSKHGGPSTQRRPKDPKKPKAPTETFRPHRCSTTPMPGSAESRVGCSSRSCRWRRGRTSSSVLVHSRPRSPRVRS